MRDGASNVFLPSITPCNVCGDVAVFPNISTTAPNPLSLASVDMTAVTGWVLSESRGRERSLSNHQSKSSRASPVASKRCPFLAVRIYFMRDLVCRRVVPTASRRNNSFPITFLQTARDCG